MVVNEGGKHVRYAYPKKIAVLVNGEMVMRDEERED